MENHRIRAYEVGPDQRATIVTIANLLQVCSMPAGTSAFCLTGRLRGRCQYSPGGGLQSPRPASIALSSIIKQYDSTLFIGGFIKNI